MNGDAIRCLLAEAAFAAPIAAAVVEVTVLRKRDRNALLFRAFEATVASEIRAATVEIAVRRDHHGDARLVRFTIAALTFPSRAITGMGRVAVSRHFDARARVVLLAITSVTFPAFVISGVDEVGVCRHGSCDAGFAALAIASIAGPGTRVAPQVRVLRYRNDRARASHFFVPVSAFPSLPVVDGSRVLGSEIRLRLRVPVLCETDAE